MTITRLSNVAPEAPRQPFLGHGTLLVTFPPSLLSHFRPALLSLALNLEPIHTSLFTYHFIHPFLLGSVPSTAKQLGQTGSSVTEAAPEIVLLPCDWLCAKVFVSKHFECL